jgi:hypothetical protein
MFSFSLTQTGAFSVNSHCKTPSCTIGTQFINSQDNLKDFSFNSTQEMQKVQRIQQLSSQQKAFSLSPEVENKKKTKIHMQKIEKLQKYLVFKTKRKAYRNGAPPILRLAEIKPEFPRNDGGNLIIHQYALPQGLVAIRTPSPAQKIQNILEDRVIPTAHPIVRKGFSGWKIPLKKFIRVERKRKSSLYSS